MIREHSTYLQVGYVRSTLWIFNQTENDTITNLGQ